MGWRVDELIDTFTSLSLTNSPIHQLTNLPTYQLETRQLRVLRSHAGGARRGDATLDDCALTILATDVSKPAADRIVLDCGSKTLTSDPARGITKSSGLWGRTGGRWGDASRVDESLAIERLSEEPATVRITGGTRLEPRDRVRVLPNHACVVSNLVDAVRLVEGDTVIDTLPVAARGKIT